MAPDQTSFSEFSGGGREGGVGGCGGGMVVKWQNSSRLIPLKTGRCRLVFLSRRKAFNVKDLIRKSFKSQ